MTYVNQHTWPWNTELLFFKLDGFSRWVLLSFCKMFSENKQKAALLFLIQASAKSLWNTSSTKFLSQMQGLFQRTRVMFFSKQCWNTKACKLMTALLLQLFRDVTAITWFVFNSHFNENVWKTFSKWFFSQAQGLFSEHERCFAGTVLKLNVGCAN